MEKEQMGGKVLKKKISHEIVQSQKDIVYERKKSTEF